MIYKLQFCIFAFCTVIASAYGGVNKNFGNCETNGANFVYAPEWLYGVHCSHLTSNDYVQANWWPVVDVEPIDIPTNMQAHAYGWTKHAIDNIRDEIDWVHNLPPDTNEWGEIIWFPVTNIVHFTTYWIERNYNLILKPVPQPVPRKFSKLKIYGAIISLPDANGTSAWQKVQTWLEGKTIQGVNGWMAFQLAQEISEDHALFAVLAEEARQLLGLTPEQFETLLNACILEY